ncbi:MAG: hypothetical protein Q4A75_00950, partial [Peptostreptococcaceae bacterium]|nr:hypothetical protein [Peptostreptococcaceae bacterium]
DCPLSGYGASNMITVKKDQKIDPQDKEKTEEIGSQEIFLEDPAEPSSTRSDIDLKEPSSQISKELLQEILIDIKKRLVINDKNAKLTYSMGSENDRTYYELLWEGEGYTQSVRYGEDKNIYYYSYRKKEDSIEDKVPKKLPQFSKDESRTIADDFINKAFPTGSKNFRQEGEVDISGEDYVFTFKYYKDDIPVIGTDARVVVNYISGKVTGFDTDYDPMTEYESTQGIIGEEEAREAYRKEIGLKKIYIYQNDDENLEYKNIRIAYAPAAYGYNIDAKTGKKQYIDPYDIMEHAGEEARADGGAEPEIQPMEEIEIKKKSELRALEEAKDAALALKLFDPEGFEMSYAYLYERGYSASRYLWAINFEREGDSYEIELDAKTLELISFFDYTGFGKYEKIKQEDIQLAKKAAEDLIKTHAEKYKEHIRLDGADLERSLGTQNDVVRMKFERYEEGVYFPGNAIYISYMPSKKKITHYNLNWTDVRLPRPTKFSDEEAVFQKIFEENGLKLAYKHIWDEKSQKHHARLFYYVEETEEMPLRFIVTTGNRIYPTDRVIKIERYEDISLSKYGSEAEMLYQIGIGFPGGLLKPTIPIMKEEALDLIASSFGSYRYPIEAASSYENKVKHWKRLGLLMEGEILDESPAKREDIAKYLVRSLGYHKLAVKKEIFKSSLYDFDQVTNGYQGYVAIAEALRMLDVQLGGEFRPKDHATRDDAIKMVYNFLAFQ